MSQERPRLAAEGLKKSYRGRTVVDGVSLQVEGGEVVGLLFECWKEQPADQGEQRWSFAGGAA